MKASIVSRRSQTVTTFAPGRSDEPNDFALNVINPVGGVQRRIHWLRATLHCKDDSSSSRAQAAIAGSGRKE